MKIITWIVSATVIVIVLHFSDGPQWPVWTAYLTGCITTAAYALIDEKSEAKGRKETLP